MLRGGVHLCLKQELLPISLVSQKNDDLELQFLS
jgi:hypothetical protein